MRYQIQPDTKDTTLFPVNTTIVTQTASFAHFFSFIYIKVFFRKYDFFIFIFIFILMTF